MGKRQLPPEEPAEIHEVMLRDALEERYLAYALSTIMHRALPDARDGLKPVHRRILYGMRLLRLDPGTPFKKSAKIVGDVMGSFHPHGDQAIYDAMVRLAQDFSSRYPLVDGQGNFGNIDGDNPAAYRYTEARMTDVARLLLEGIDEDGVEFRPNYDGQTQGAGGSARRLPEPARQRLAGHRGRHGHLDPAAQRGRAVRRRAASDRQARRQVEVAAEMGQGPGFPDRRHHRRFQGKHRRSLHDRARLVPHPRQVDPGRGRARHLGRRHHRDPVAGAEVAAGREDRRTAQREEAAAGRRRQGRVGRRRPPRDRAEIPRGRSGADDGIAVPAHRARKQDFAEPQRADQGQDPQGGGACRVPARMARPSARRAGAPLQLPQDADREPARSARRLPDRLSEHRQGDQDHPHRG